MTVFVTKASDDYWYEIKTFYTMEDIQQFIIEYDGIIVEKNSYTDDVLFEFWEGMKSEDIPIIKKCPLNIIIYDDWVE